MSAAALAALTPGPAPAPPADLFVGDPWVGTDMEMHVADGGRPKRIIFGFSGIAYIRLRVEGVRQSRKRWRGTYRASARVVKDGKRVDTCRPGRKKWEAIRRSRFHFEVAGSSGD